MTQAGRGRRCGKTRAFALLAALIAALGVLSGCGSSSESTAKRPASPAPVIPGVDAANTRNRQADDRQLQRRQPRAGLDRRRSPASSAFGSYASTPVIDKGVDLLPGPRLQRAGAQPGVRRGALDERPTNSPILRAQRRRRRRRATSSARPRPKPSRSTRKPAKQLWSTILPRNAHEGIDMAPGYQRRHRLRLDRAGQRRPSSTKAAASAILWALDAKTGKKVWHFDTVPKDLWGNSKVNSGGGLWYPPAFDGKGSMYFGIGNPAPFPGTDSTPGGRAGRARTSTPTRWSSSTRRPARWTGTTR